MIKNQVQSTICRSIRLYFANKKKTLIKLGGEIEVVPNELVYSKVLGHFLKILDFWKALFYALNCYDISTESVELTKLSSVINFTLDCFIF